MCAHAGSAVGTTYLLVRNNDSSVVFRDSHVQLQWDFSDAAAFQEWFAHEWAVENYFQFHRTDPTKPKDGVDVTVFRQSKVRSLNTVLFHFVEARERYITACTGDGITHARATAILKEAKNNLATAEAAAALEGGKHRYMQYCQLDLDLTADEALTFLEEAGGNLETAEENAETEAGIRASMVLSPITGTCNIASFSVVLRTASGASLTVELPDGAETTVEFIHTMCYDKFEWSGAASSSSLILTAANTATPTKLEALGASGQLLSLKDHSVTESSSELFVIQQPAPATSAPAGDQAATATAAAAAGGGGGGGGGTAAAVAAAADSAAGRSKFAKHAWASLRRRFVADSRPRQPIWNPVADGRRLQGIVNALFAALDRDGNGKIELDDFAKLMAVAESGVGGLGAEMVRRLWAKMQAVATASLAASRPAVPLLPGTTALLPHAIITPGIFSSSLIFLAVYKTPQRISMAFPLVSSAPSPPLSPLGMVSSPVGANELPAATADQEDGDAADCTISNYFARAELKENPPGGLLLGGSIERWCTSLRIELVDARASGDSDPAIERLGSTLLADEQ